MGEAGNEIPVKDWRQRLRIPGDKVIFMKRTVPALIIALALMVAGRSEATAQTFTPQTNIVLTGVFNCAVVWGDYDNDGKLDILLTGETEEGINSPEIRGNERIVRYPTEHAAVSKIYRNMGNGSFVEQPGIVLTPIKECSAAWGDYDNDGYLDILAVGGTSKIYHNNGGSSFTELTEAGLIDGVDHTSVVWGDLDNDGYLDILLTGVQEQQGFHIVAKMYRNDGKGLFGLLDNVRLEPVQRSSVALCDYDRDGYLDILLTGGQANGAASILYRNEGNSFLPAATGIVFSPVLRCAVAWGDYDNDGNPDILLAGQCPSMNKWQPVTRLYHNNGNNTFTEQTNVSFAQVMRPGIAWGDYDNDSNIDILLSGMTADHTVVTKVYRNDGHGGFEEQTSITLDAVFRSSAAWGDYDNDGKLDILLAGARTMGQNSDFGGKPVTIVYHNESAVSNKPPTAPTGLTAVYAGGVVRFSWTAAQDAETPSKALTYNLRIGSRPGAADHFSTMSDASNGFRRIPQFGPVQGTNWTWVPRGISSGSTIYWSVQAIDGGLAGSPFAPEQTFAIGTLTLNPVNVTATDGTCAYAVKLSWDSTDAQSYEIWRSTNSDRRTAQHVSEGHDPAGALYDDSATGRGIEYYYWVRAVYTNSSGILVGPAKGWRPPFDEETNVVFPGAGGAAWGDYDNDGKLDVLLIDGTNEASSLSRLYRNKGEGTFEEQTNTVLPAAIAAVWADLDNDGRIDVLMLSDGKLTICHNNAGNSFEQLHIADFGVMLTASIACGDYDNDGRTDILVTGKTDYGSISKIYRNSGHNTFSEQPSIHLAQVFASGAAWGDCDNDGDLDILLAGGITYRNEGNLAASKVYRNNGNNTFREESWVDLPGVVNARLGWGDYDNDGNLDILLTGMCFAPNYGPQATVFHNEGNKTFTEQWSMSGNEALKADWTWCDCDGDGDLDIVGASELYRNNGNGSFTKLDRVIPDGICVWGDYNNDGKLDCVRMDGNQSRLYRNFFGNSNQPPAAPTTPAVAVSSNVVRFTWNSSKDDNTPDAGLNYNVRVGSAPGGCDIVSPMADSKTGFRRIPARGPIQGTNWFIRGLTNGTYYFAVQAIDTSLAGSLFSEEIKFSVANSPAGK
jgi:hypothetical protein